MRPQLVENCPMCEFNLYKKVCLNPECMAGAMTYELTERLDELFPNRPTPSEKVRTIVIVTTGDTTMISIHPEMLERLGLASEDPIDQVH